MEVDLPPLKQRIEDVPLLVDNFCRLFNERFNKCIDGVCNSVLGSLMNYAWPGNVRELEHVLEHAFVLCNGPVITLDHLPMEMRVSAYTKDMSSQSIKKQNAAQEVLDALRKTHWNKTKAARLLRVDRRTVHRRIKKYNLLENSPNHWDISL